MDFMDRVRKEVEEDPELARLVAQEELVLTVTELILQKMEEKGIDKGQLASLLGTSKGHLTLVFRGTRKMTLRMLADIFFILDCQIRINVVAKESS